MEEKTAVFGGIEFHFKLDESKSSTVDVRIEPDGAPRLTLPQEVGKAELWMFVGEKQIRIRLIATGNTIEIAADDDRGLWGDCYGEDPNAVSIVAPRLVLAIEGSTATAKAVLGHDGGVDQPPCEFCDISPKEVTLGTVGF